ncbi:hypothetical protein A2533_02555 [Candidatus Falkowbacteria bacterium RIFOXYD2_FULL_35_9]|nr:MAG: hypothetical protein A2533_02555 [Candidatus Falkowbacteria bacterium RIFOXYD2_FULL_35_9]
MKSLHVKLLKETAKQLGLKFKSYDGENVLHEVSNGKKSFLIDRSATELTSRLGYILADNKHLTISALNKFDIPVPQQRMVKKYQDSLAFFKKNKPIVVKPNKCSLGKGVTVNVKTLEDLKKAFHYAKRYDSRVLVEEFIPGEDYRFTVIDYKQVYVVKRIPAFVIGDGKHSMLYLIKQKNKVKKSYKKDIKTNEKTIEILKEKKLTLRSIPAKDEIVYLRKAANIAEGGTSIDFTDIASKPLKDLAIAACRVLHLPVAGIDILTENINGDKGVIIEVNPRPHIILHHYPHEGESRYPARDIYNMLFGKKLKLRK